ncbi:MAG: class I SAM-dependent methyltransferase [Acidobacteriota bacterium]
MTARVSSLWARFTAPFAGRRRADATPLEPDAAYARWAPAYPPRAHTPLMEAEQAVVLECLGLVAGRRVLDAGCGSGRYLRLLAARGATVVGVDRSSAMVARARALAAPVVRGDLQALPVATGSMDLVVCGLALGDVADLGAAIRELARTLRPGGRLVYSVVHPDGARRGWSRAFEGEGGRWAVRTWWHARAAHEQACADAGLRIDRWQEAALPTDPAVPVALIIGATKDPGEA